MNCRQIIQLHKYGEHNNQWQYSVCQLMELRATRRLWCQVLLKTSCHSLSMVCTELFFHLLMWLTKWITLSIILCNSKWVEFNTPTDITYRVAQKVSVRYSKWRLRILWHQLALASSEFCLNELLYGDLCRNFFYFHIFSVFFQTILSDTSILLKSQLITQIRSHMEYLTQTYF